MVEDSHDWAREDELDLGQEDEEEQQHVSPSGQDGTDNTALEVIRNGSMALVEEDLSPETEVNGHEQTAEDDAPPVDLPSPPPRPELLRGSVDETASTPDDTPSLQVIASHRSILCVYADGRRALSAPSLVVMSSRSEPVPIRPIVPSIYGSSRDSPPPRRRSARERPRHTWDMSIRDIPRWSASSLRARSIPVTKTRRAHGMWYGGLDCGRSLDKRSRRLGSGTLVIRLAWRLPHPS